MMSNEAGKKLELAEKLQALSEHHKYHKLKYVFPSTGPFRRELYAAHCAFFKAGKDKRFRVFCGGNRSGKSFTTGCEISFHATGEYPEWWEGRVLKKPQQIWIVAESGALFRDSLQKLLFGEAGEDVGTGLLPLADKNNGVGIVDYKAMPGTPGTVGSCIIKHKKGHFVSIIIKTNEMQREQFQAAKVDIVLFDEEPKEEIYVECLMRLMGTGTKEPGIAMFAFTPLKGLSTVVLRFLPNGQFPERGSPIDEPEKYICRVEWQDVPHLTEADKAALLKEIPPNERDARTKGIPALGSGRIYPVEEEFVVIKPFQIPEYWPRAYGLDFGWTATAAVWVAEDPTTKVRYVYAEYKRGKLIDDLHIEAVKSKGQWIRGVSDPSKGSRRDDGTLRVDYFRSKGLSLEEGENALAAGISRLHSQFETGSLKIFSNCQELIKEYRLYRYDTKDPNHPARNQEDHILDALRYLDSKFEWVSSSLLDQEEDDRNDFWKQKKRSTRDRTTGY